MLGRFNLIRNVVFDKGVWPIAALLSIAGLCFVESATAAGVKAYVGNFKDNTVSVIDTTEKRVVATIPIPTGPHGMVVTPDNRWLYVSSDGASTVSVIDTATDKLVENVEVGRNPMGLQLRRMAGLSWSPFTIRTPLCSSIPAAAG
jgi:YVTN family beta-propeller protein